MESINARLTPNSFMRNVTIIYYAMLIGMLIFGGVTLFLTIPLDSTLPTTDDTFVFAVPLFAFIGVFLGRVLYKRKTDDLSKVESLRSKVLTFQTALIIKFALVEGPYLLGVVATLLSNNLFYLMISVTLVLYFITLKPSWYQIKKDLHLSTNMSLHLNDKNQILD